MLNRSLMQWVIKMFVNLVLAELQSAHNHIASDKVISKSESFLSKVPVLTESGM